MILPNQDDALTEASEVARAIIEETGFAPALDDARLQAWDYVFPLFNWDEHPKVGPTLTEASIAKALDDTAAESLAAVPDIAMRAAIAAGLFTLIDEHEPKRGMEELAHFLRLQPVGLIDNARDLRWEIHAAATAGDPIRVVSLIHRLSSISHEYADEAIAAHILFCCVHPASFRPLTPSSLDPDIRMPEWEHPEISELTTFILAFVTTARPKLPWQNPSDFDADTRQNIAGLQAWLDRAEARGERLTPTQQGLAAWCRFALGSALRKANLLVDAANRYIATPAHPLLLDDPQLSVDKLRYGAATTCHARAGEWSLAADAARKWVTAAPTDATAHRELAKALHKLDRTLEATEAYEAYTRCRNDDADDWEATMLLKLALQVKNDTAVSLAIETAAMATPFKAQGEALSLWFEPWMSSLSPRAQQRWWAGLYYVSSPHIASDLGDARWDHAADSFGEAVALHLRDAIFIPFSQSHPTLAPPNNHWRAVLSGRGMLGELIECLLQARIPQSVAAKALREWVDAHCRRLLPFLTKTDPKRLLELARLRGEAQHGSVTETQTRFVFEVAQALLAAAVE